LDEDVRPGSGSVRPEAEGPMIGARLEFSAEGSAAIAPPLEALQGLEVRIGLFRRWMRTLVEDRPFFLTDAEGFILASERVPTDRAVVAPVLERALRVVRPFLGTSRARGVDIELEDGQRVMVKWYGTPRGRVGLGVFGGPPLDADRTAWIAGALARVFAKEGDR